MIYEFRTYTLKPGTLGTFVQRWQDKLARRLELSPLAAFWYTDIGPLNQVVHVWPYKDTNHRAETRAAAVKAGIWPPDTMPFIIDMRSDILEPLPFSPPLEPSNHGPYFEMRSYTLEAGGTQRMAASWETHLAARTRLSPLIGVFTADIGSLNQWVHIWAYKSLDERAAVRKAAAESGVWPPPPPSPMLRGDSKILLPGPFSPIR